MMAKELMLPRQTKNMTKMALKSSDDEDEEMEEQPKQNNDK